MTAVDSSPPGHSDHGVAALSKAGSGVFDTAMLAHDIRSALQGVVGGVAVMEHLTTDASMREQIDRVSAAAMSLSGYVQRLLDDSTAEEISEASQDGLIVSKFASALRRRWLGEAHEKGLGFEIEVDARLPKRLDIPRFELNRILGNLIANAVRHSDLGCVRVAFGQEADGTVAFSVTDEGPGLPDAVIERFSRMGLDPSIDLAAVHGLGLHVVRRVSESIGGRAELGAAAGGGTAATIRFPAQAFDYAVAATPERVESARGSARSGIDLNGARILLSEDNPTNQMVANQMLRALNAEVTITSDGVEAMEAFEISEFDLVVVDIEMPRMSGLDVIRAIRSRNDGRDRTPVVALTAYALREHRERISEAGANGLISKPITSIDALGRALASYVDIPAKLAETSAGTACEADPPVIDMLIYGALCEAIGVEMMDELLEKVVGDLETAGRDLAGAVEPLDAALIRSASHILISVAGAIGATRLQDCARALNTSAHGDSSEDVAEQVSGCLAELAAAVNFALDRRKAA